ncbi:MAG: Kelch repeat-containing protein [Promethearchaeota archaeon]
MKYRVITIVFIVMILAMLGAPSSEAKSNLAEVTVTPEARGAHSMAFDPHNEVTVLFGGFTTIGGWRSLGDTWVYSYADNSWTQLSLTPSPSPRSNHAMVYCNETDEIILYGGQGQPTNPTDTWSFACDTQTWSQVVTVTNPGVHHSLALAYDPQENAVILFGGFGNDGLERDDTWKFDCATREWSQLTPTTAPLARYGHVMAYDESIDKIVMTAGNTATQGHQHDTWTFDAATSNWTQLTPSSYPDRLKWPSMVFDSVDQKCILFAGQIGDNPVNRTWVYDGVLNTWTRRYPDSAPANRINAGLAFDSVNNMVIMFGGATFEIEPYDDTWVYSYEDNVWTEMDEGSTTLTGIDPATLLLVIVPPIIVAAIAVVLIVRRRK